MSFLDYAPDTLSADNLSFRFYAQHVRGVTLNELSKQTGWSEPWIAKRIEAVQTFLQRHASDGGDRVIGLCSDQIWADQVWD